MNGVLGHGNGLQAMRSGYRPVLIMLSGLIHMNFAKQSQFTPKGVVVRVISSAAKRSREIFLNRFLHFRPLCGPTVEMTKAQILITIDINHGFHFAETTISDILSNIDNREKPLIALLPKEIRAGGKRK